ncbi:MAG: PAS domain-containing protein [Chitinispirillaceae bacterium]|jgi:PAS domain S-box-containing protein|nr:PAS domain-containing protein [Chitinispirillaceae bacterium]
MAIPPETPSGTKLGRINAELLTLGSDHGKNIRRLTALCGELLNGTCALFNCIQDGLLTSVATWNTPPDFNPVDYPDGHICYDVIRKGDDQAVVIRNLPASSYAKTDPNVLHYKLQTYIGKSVKSSGVHLGSLCIVFQSDVDFSEEEKQCVSLLASLVGIEQDRKNEYERLLCAESRFRSFVEHHNDAVCRWTSEMVLTYTNPAFNALFNVDGKSLVGKRWIDVIPGLSHDKAEEFYMKLIDDPQVVSTFLFLPGAGGRRRKYRWTTIPVVNPAGRVVEIHSVGREMDRAATSSRTDKPAPPKTSP